MPRQARRYPGGAADAARAARGDSVRNPCGHHARVILPRGSRGDGFIHYAVVEVERIEEVPEGMVTISVPALTYAACSHRKGQSIDQSYNNIYAWIKEQGYSEYNPDHLTHFEQYPMSQDPYTDDPEFMIMIPVQSE